MHRLQRSTPKRLISVLSAHRVRHVLIGALAARMQGFPRVTADIDITPARDSDNLKRLAAALRELGAKVFTETIPEGLAFDCSAPMLDRANMWNLVTDAGRVDLAFQPAGTAGYDDLACGAVHFKVWVRRSWSRAWKTFSARRKRPTGRRTGRTC